MTGSFTVNQQAFEFILKQIEASELQSTGVSTIQAICGVSAGDAALLPAGPRAVGGRNDNLLPGHADNGDGDTLTGINTKASTGAQIRIAEYAPSSRAISSPETRDRARRDGMRRVATTGGSVWRSHIRIERDLADLRATPAGTLRKSDVCTGGRVF